MISVDTVYQRVLASANKEQRGYVTPQEFNLFANQVQMDIFDQYFYDVDKFSRVHGNETEAGDMLDLLNEKIDIFEMKNQPIGTSCTVLPAMPGSPEIYILGNIFLITGARVFEVERVSEKEKELMLEGPLTRPQTERPIYVRTGKNGGGFDTVAVWTRNPTTGAVIQATSGCACNYTRRPARVNWDFVVVNGYAQFNGTTHVDFELHPSEENNLVYKILELVGVVMKDANLYQIASQEEIKDIQQEKS